MSNYYKSTLDLIGNTPLVEVTNIEKDQNQIGRASCRERV